MYRRLLLCPKGLHAAKDFIAVYLDSPESGWVPDHLNPKAWFKLTAINQAKVGEDFYKGEAECGRMCVCVGGGGRKTEEGRAHRQ